MRKNIILLISILLCSIVSNYPSYSQMSSFNQNVTEKEQIPTGADYGDYLCMSKASIVLS